jgi:hypothetical protein
VITPEEISPLVLELSCLRFFPADVDAQTAIAKELVSMATNLDQVRWLIERMKREYTDWPGPRMLREVFCNRFKPADDYDPCLPQREDGFGGPMKALSEPDRLKVLAAGPEPLEGPRLLTSGELVSRDPTIAGLAAIALVGIAARSSTLTEATTAEEIRTAPAWLRELEGYSTPEAPKQMAPVRWDEAAKDGKGGWVPV